MNSILEVESFCNEDLSNIVMPIDEDKLVQLLYESKYDKKETLFLIDGFTNGLTLDMRVRKLGRASPRISLSPRVLETNTTCGLKS